MFDFCINGSGMVGAALALGLGQQGYRVAVIEKQVPEAFSPSQPPDLRLSALSHNSVALLDKLGAWRHIHTMRCKSYSQLSVWEQGAGSTDFDARDLALSELGFFVENRVVQLGCIDALTSQNTVTRFTNTEVKALERSPAKDNTITLSLSNGQSIECRWLIGADGATSRVRQLANIGTEGWQYAQHAMGVTVKSEKISPDVTWQMFTPTGPRALLPMYEHYASLIWYDSAERLGRLSQLDSAALKQALVDAFPARLSEDIGDFSVINRATFPLTRSHARRYVLPGIILIGDAAHTINPLAGQGVNLGFKDVQSLLSVTEARLDIASQLFLNALRDDYEAVRRKDNLTMMSAMDAFYLGFSNDIGPLKWVRQSLLKLVQNAHWGKQQVLKYALGMK